MPTLELSLHIREVSPEQAEKIKHEVAEAVALVTGEGPSMSSKISSTILPDFEDER